MAGKPEEVLSIPEMDVSESLSVEDKKTIIQAFDNLAPDKEYKINYVEKPPLIASAVTHGDYSYLTKAENALLRKLKSKKRLSAKEKTQLDFLTKKISNSYKSEIVVEEELPPIKSITNTKIRTKIKKKRSRLKDLVANRASKEKLAEKVSRTKKGTIMVQIASVSSKAAAESEYNRLISRNRFLIRRRGICCDIFFYSRFIRITYFLS